MIIGLTGTTGGGKDTVQDFLTSKGFIGYSLSDILRGECSSRGLEVNRDNLISIGNELRKNFGYGILAEKTIEKIKSKNQQDCNIVINSIRHPSEVDALRKLKGFYLVSIDAPLEVRFERVKGRKKGKEDDVDFEKFKEQERLDGSGEELRLNPTMKLADIQIINDESLEGLHKKVDDFIDSISFKN